MARVLGPITLEQYAFRLEQANALLQDKVDWAITALARSHRCANCSTCQCGNDWPDPKR